MSKELEHLKILEDWANENYGSKEVWKHSIPIQEALERLESISSIEPNEALKELEEIMEYITEDKKVKYKATILFDCEIIEDALLKARAQEVDTIHYKGTVENLRRDNALLKDIKNEQEKILKIVFEKNVNTLLLELAGNVDEYNERIVPNGQLTEEEFDSLKRWENV